ncbi:YARHG domain-containing protein [Bacillus sp. EAC]|uniref:YARHG domain-containing protein n=1 Tax=Bacillus sp. EAC TaxID=1978338 RepID=UPI000B4521E2|nr:YARHG domain-containing protein [Bacillus sp. EAC]
MAYKKVESRIDKRKFNNSKIKQLLTILIPIAGVIILGTTAIFYVYPKITNGGEKHTKSVATKAVKEVKKDENKVEVTEKPAEQTTTSGTEDTEEATNSTDFILPDSNLKNLTNGDIERLTPSDLRIARNEIYARHGFVFKSADLNNYFATKSWYSQDPTYQGTLNEFEKYNLSLIKAREDSMN